MTANIISDIHATVGLGNEVMYNMPMPFKQKKYDHTAEVLREHFHVHEAELSKCKVEEPFDLPSTFTETFKCSTFGDLLSLVDLLEEKVKAKFEGATRDEVFTISRALGKLELFIAKNKVQWHWHKDVLAIDNLRDYMFKCAFSFDPAKLEPADYLIIAGDLGLEPIYDLVLKDIEEKTAGKFKKVLHIAGNHDHWWHRVTGLSEERPDHPNLDRDYCEHVDGDCAFIGCTLWTPIPERDVWTVGRYMNDYRYIPGKFSPYASSHQYEIQSAWLRSKLAQHAEKKCVVFTHHQPFEELTLDDYKHNGKGWDGIDVNSAYVVQDHSLDDIQDQHHNIVLWACGHTHQNYDGMLHGIHVVRNPIGYRDTVGSRYVCPENTAGTWYSKVVEF